jgi:RHS repeat-associated protein
MKALEADAIEQPGTTHKFTGKERDGESGLDYFGARHLASTLGRFMTPDPYMPSADVKDPQSWNRYTYARNNPLRYIDPDGLDYSDLSQEQRRVFQGYADEYCKQNKEFCEQNKGDQLSEKIYGTLSESQMATFESVTFALEHTQLVDANGNSMGNALQQVAGVTRIAGEVPGASGDQQFRVYADLKLGAIETFAKAQGFEASSNKVLGHIPDLSQGVSRQLPADKNRRREGLGSRTPELLQLRQSQGRHRCRLPIRSRTSKASKLRCSSTGKLPEIHRSLARPSQLVG